MKTEAEIREWLDRYEEEWMATDPVEDPLYKAKMAAKIEALSWVLSDDAVLVCKEGED